MRKKHKRFIGFLRILYLFAAILIFLSLEILLQFLPDFKIFTL